jgi:hypothetical protein
MTFDLEIMPLNLKSIHRVVPIAGNKNVLL